MSDRLQTARRVLASLSCGHVDEIAAHLDEHVVMENPFAPAGFPERIEGRDAVMGALHFVDGAFTRFRVVVHDAYECAGRDTVICEATSRAEVAPGGRTYQNRYVFVFGFAGARILHWREYYNPLQILTADLSPRESPRRAHRIESGN